jgi:hypothetical protein
MAMMVGCSTALNISVIPQGPYPDLLAEVDLAHFVESNVKWRWANVFLRLCFWLFINFIDPELCFYFCCAFGFFSFQKDLPWVGIDWGSEEWLYHFRTWANPVWVRVVKFGFTQPCGLTTQLSMVLYTQYLKETVHWNSSFFSLLIQCFIEIK